MGTDIYFGAKSGAELNMGNEAYARDYFFFDLISCGKARGMLHCQGLAVPEKSGDYCMEMEVSVADFDAFEHGISLQSEIYCAHWQYKRNIPTHELMTDFRRERLARLRKVAEELEAKGDRLVIGFGD